MNCHEEKCDTNGTKIVIQWNVISFFLLLDSLSRSFSNKLRLIAPDCNDMRGVIAEEILL